MAKPLERRNTLFTEGFQSHKNVPVVSKVLSDGDGRQETASYLKFADIPLDDITPRPKNLYRQSRIERLARSIRNTNNRLIHPIVLARPSDLPQDSEIIKAFSDQGVDCGSVKYVIVAGERRFRAFRLLQAEEAEKVKGSFDSYNCFDKIPANILTKAEAQNEKFYYEDSNMEARQLSIFETFLHVQDALGEIDTPEKKAAALKEMGREDNGKKFNEITYIKYYIENELGIDNVPERRLKDCQRICNNGVSSLQKALMEELLDLTMAGEISHCEKETQEALITLLYAEGTAAVKEKLRELSENTGKSRQRVTNKDVEREVDNILKSMNKHRKELERLSEELGKTDRCNTKKILKEMDQMIRKIEEVVPTFK